MTMWQTSALPVEMIPEKLRKSIPTMGDATMMLVLFDNTTSSDDSMEAIEDLRKIGRTSSASSAVTTGVVTDIKNVALKSCRFTLSSPQF